MNNRITPEQERESCRIYYWQMTDSIRASMAFASAETCDYYSDLLDKAYAVWRSYRDERIDYLHTMRQLSNLYMEYVKGALERL